MIKTGKTKKALIIAVFLFLAFFCYEYLFNSSARADSLDFANTEKLVSIDDNGSLFDTVTSSNDVGSLLEEKNILLGEHDVVIPEEHSSVYPGMTVRIDRAVKIKIAADGNITDVYTTEKTIGAVLRDNNITLGHLDKVSPEISSRPLDGLTITITRINIEEVTETEEIDFKTITNNDPKLGWHEQKITQEGEKGIQEVRYRITYKDGKEFSRVILEKNITKDPVTQVMTQGTYMELGKAKKGQGTWYAWKGGLFAASTTIPKGAFAKVTNLYNGKTVIVQINDYGPQGKGRIIDLDKVAFAKIASLGAGVIDVKVEQILN